MYAILLAPTSIFYIDIKALLLAFKTLLHMLSAFKMLATKLWNTLPKAIRDLSLGNNFTHAMKALLFHLAFVILTCF